MNKKQLNEAIAKAIQINPYIKNCVVYYKGYQEMYLWKGVGSFTAEELLEEYRKTAEKDIIHGYEERMVGYYDKWYRYSRADEGRAYDLGVKIAAQSGKCPEEFTIIPCMH